MRGLKRLYFKVAAARHRRAAIEKLRKLEAKLPSREARFAVPFAFEGRGLFRSVEPKQNAAEIETLYRRVCVLEPGVVVEIGTARGGTLYLWTQAARPDALLVSIDLPGGEFGGAYPAAREPFYRAFARPGQELLLIRKDSHSAEAIESVRAKLQARAVDFLFIDGDHRYEGVRRDFEIYAPLVRAGGLVALHDILPRADMPEIQVHRLWQEIRAGRDAVELIGPDGSGRKIGIGLIRV